VERREFGRARAFTDLRRDQARFHIPRLAIAALSLDVSLRRGLDWILTSLFASRFIVDTLGFRVGLYSVRIYSSRACVRVYPCLRGCLFGLCDGGPLVLKAGFPGLVLGYFRRFFADYSSIC
jgi:hypothetical protein